MSQLFALFMEESSFIEEEQAADPAANDIQVGEESGSITYDMLMIVKYELVNPE